MRALVVSLLAMTALSAAPAGQTFIGVITDDMCERADHSRMQMGPTEAECTTACVGIHGSVYVLYDGKNVYALSDQQKPEAFAAQRVRIIGTLDAKTKTIHVASITRVQ